MEIHCYYGLLFFFQAAKYVHSFKHYFEEDGIFIFFFFNLKIQEGSWYCGVGHLKVGKILEWIRMNTAYLSLIQVVYVWCYPILSCFQYIAAYGWHPLDEQLGCICFSPLPSGYPLPYWVHSLKLCLELFIFLMQFSVAHFTVGSSGS